MEPARRFLGISYSSHCFCKWNWKAEAPRGLSDLLWWVKSALMRFKRGCRLRQKLCPTTQPFVRTVSAPEQRPPPPPPQPLSTSTHQDPLVWPLTDMHGQASRVQSKRLNQQAPRGATGDDWHSQDNLPLKHCWVFSLLQRGFQSIVCHCLVVFLPSYPSPSHPTLPFLPPLHLHLSLPSLSPFWLPIFLISWLFFFTPKKWSLFSKSSFQTDWIRQHSCAFLCRIGKRWHGTAQTLWTLYCL